MKELNKLKTEALLSDNFLLAEVLNEMGAVIDYQGRTHARFWHELLSNYAWGNRSLIFVLTEYEYTIYDEILNLEWTNDSSLSFALGRYFGEDYPF